MNIIVRTPDQKEEKRKKICLDQLVLDRQQLLMRWPFIGGIIMRMDLIAVRDDRLETACTDGNSIFTDINFYGSLTKDQRLFVLAHEVWHSVLLHFARCGKRDRKLFNIAADLEIHFTLKDEKMHEPWVLPHDLAWEGLSAEEIYEQLVKNGFTAEKKNFDCHIYEDDKLQNQLETDNGKNSQDDKKVSSDSAVVIDHDYNPIVLPDTSERVRGRVIASAQQLERMNGKLPHSAEKLLEQLMTPELSWQSLLKQFVSSCYGGKRRWLPPARRHIWQDLYLPSMRDEKIKVAVAIDTSASTSEDVKLFFSELESLMKSFGRYELTLIQCDAAIQSVEEFTDFRPISSHHQWAVHGLGGTDFRPVFDYVSKQSEQPELLVYMTDGTGTAPFLPPPFPVLWVLTNDGTKPCSWGKSICFKRDAIY